MEGLYDELTKIEELLEQIGSITSNQTTVLLQQDEEQSEEAVIEMLETMVEYKEELINQLQDVEAVFNKGYMQVKDKLKDKNEILRFKEHVARILEKKQRIQEMEQNNVRIMQAREKRSEKNMKIMHNPQEVVAAYKKQQDKKGGQ